MWRKLGIVSALVRESSRGNLRRKTLHLLALEGCYSKVAAGTLEFQCFGALGLNFLLNRHSVSVEPVLRSWSDWGLGKTDIFFMQANHTRKIMVLHIQTSTRAMAKHILRQTNKLYLHHHLASISDFFNSIHIAKFIGLVILLFYFDISCVCCVLFVKFEKKIKSIFYTMSNWRFDSRC